jgi:hypothetical protein
VQIAWTGTRYGLAWHDQRPGNSEIYFAAVDAAGVKLTADVRVSTSPARSWMPSIVWTGAGFAIAYTEDASTFANRVFLALVDADGAGAGGAPISDVSAWVGEAMASWSGDRLAVVWDDDRSGDRDIYTTFLSAAGVEQGPDARITATAEYSDEPFVAWNGAEYRLLWQEHLAAGGFATAAADLDTSGARLTADALLGQSGLSPGRPRIAWIGDRHAVLWQVPVGTSQRQLLFATITPR